ncbi:hypothetical protein [Natranaeroarchaeum sulfidigenes]|uniref:hypothetical protein n=1 Tax=Natranaeroarchaeum sulfidigenes TaxID=2784880 RepID=UPI001EE5AE0D|nr:hypothetical protein [Natranaeroarchaeum sulfidigenes]
MSTLTAFYVPDLEGRLVGRPEGERNAHVAFPEFRAADFASRGPFPERNLL